MTYDTSKEIERAVLVGVDTEKGVLNIHASLNELEELAKTAGAVVSGRLTQKRSVPNRAYYIGTGKLVELKDLVNLLDATIIIFDDELSPSQLRHLVDYFDIKVIDRTLLILDIFAGRAHSAEGKVQVELAQLKYSLSRLTGLGKSLSRLAGGIGTRGPGESKLESDRRYIKDRITHLGRELEEIKIQRGVSRNRREKDGMPVVSLVGYTNSGKSSLMNYITKADVLAEDKLFATLDTTTRKAELPNGVTILLTDTVGFIQKLPHQLIQAFRATLEEINFATLLIHVVDASSVMRKEQMGVVYETIKNLKYDEKPVITVFNKMDLQVELPIPTDEFALSQCEISALNGTNVQELLETIEAYLNGLKNKLTVIIPYSDGSVLSNIHQTCDILKEEHRHNGTFLELYADDHMENVLNKYLYCENIVETE